MARALESLYRGLCTGAEQGPEQPNSGHAERLVSGSHHIELGNLTVGRTRAKFINRWTACESVETSTSPRARQRKIDSPTLDMSGGWRQAKLAGRRPLDGRAGHQRLLLRGTPASWAML